MEDASLRITLFYLVAGFFQLNFYIETSLI